ncbi:MAG TPA: HAMP domain-containing sensor histidine kinase [Gemmatimonadales bacterium]|nr:HAMP domain-containing sensor histidine kinase [Gemmatimonadales bacterium]
MRRPSFSSIAFRLPLLIGTLLVIVAGVYTAAAYRAIQRASVAVATDRLNAVADELAQLLRGSRRQLLVGLRATADSAVVRRYLIRQERGLRARVGAILRPPSSPAIAAVELWNTGRGQVLSAGDPRWARASDSAVLAAVSAGDSGVVGGFQAIGDSIAYPVAAPVKVNGRVRGYVIQWWKVANTPQQREQTSQLIGSRSRLYIGNADGDVWTDLGARVPGPPVDVGKATGVLRYQREGLGPVLAAAKRVVAAPWIVVVEFPESVVLAPARLFLRTLLLLGAVIVALGLIGAWLLSRRITRPLARLTQAAETVAAGDYSQPVTGEHRADELGRLAAAFGTMVTRVREEQHRLEERVRDRTAELEERNEELEAFGYTISHDLRAPLRAMEGFSNVLLEEYRDRLDAAGRNYAERVVAAARTMDQLIQDLLSYSRLTRAELPLVAVDLTRLAAQAVARMDGDLKKRGAEVRVDEALPSVTANPSTLAQVIDNLLSNAVKFVPPGRAPVVRVRAERRGELVRLWVEDNGIGIATEHQERIFRVFERLNPASEYPGTGVGLAIVRKGAERMGGHAGVESAPGRGSRFWVDLPLATSTGEG